MKTAEEESLGILVVDAAIAWYRRGVERLATSRAANMMYDNPRSDVVARAEAELMSTESAAQYSSSQFKLLELLARLDKASRK